MLRKRLQRLERLAKWMVAPPQPEKSVSETDREFDRRWVQLWEQLFGTMSPEHAVIVEAEVEPYVAWMCRSQGRRDHPGRPDPRPQLSALADRAFELVLYAAPGDHDREEPIALPPVVADVFLSDPQVELGDTCTVCRYRLPVHKIEPGNYRPHFQECPLCGGQLYRFGRDTA